MSLRRPARARRILAAGVIFALGVAEIAILIIAGRSRPVGHGSRAEVAASPERSVASRRLMYGPRRPVPASGAQQSAVDSALSHEEQPAVVPPGGAIALPAGVYSTAYPAIAVDDRNDPSAYATAFVTELVDRDYTLQSRQQLLAWAQAESAPNTLPGVTPGLAAHSLVLSLLEPTPPPGPVPSPAGWAQQVLSQRVQTVANVEAAVNPAWMALTSTGWEPADPTMTILTVTGNLVSNGLGGARTESFSLDLTLGSNWSRSGFGAVAVDDWSVT